MADSRFFDRRGPYSLRQLADIAEAELKNAPDVERMFDDVAPLALAEATNVSFLDNRKYVSDFMSSLAGACLVDPSLAGKAPAGMCLMVTSEPYRAYARVAQAFYPAPTSNGKISTGASIASSAKLGENVQIDTGVVVGPRAEISDGCMIAANSVVGSGVVIGHDSVIGENVTLKFCKIGDRVIIHSGVSIGQDGFGFAMGPQGHLKVPQLGRVMIGDDVEIGANAAIDRGTGPDTVIGNGCKIDNLVQIGHNVELGSGCIIVAQVGIAGSTKLDPFVAAGGQAGFAGHLKIGAGAQIAAQSGVMRDIPAGDRVGGSPAVPMRDFMRQTGALQRLTRKRKS